MPFRQTSLLEYFRLVITWFCGTPSPSPSTPDSDQLLGSSQPILSSSSLAAICEKTQLTLPEAFARHTQTHPDSPHDSDTHSVAITKMLIAIPDCDDGSAEASAGPQGDGDDAGTSES